MKQHCLYNFFKVVLKLIPIIFSLYAGGYQLSLGCHTSSAAITLTHSPTLLSVSIGMFAVARLVLPHPGIFIAYRKYFTVLLSKFTYVQQICKQT